MAPAPQEQLPLAFRFRELVVAEKPGPQKSCISLLGVEARACHPEFKAQTVCSDILSRKTKQNQTENKSEQGTVGLWYPAPAWFSLTLAPGDPAPSAGL